MRKHWFKRKLYGYGWYPVSKEGWVVTIVAVLLIIVFSKLIEVDSLAGIIYLVLTVVALVTICMLTGEKAKWSWGK
ncbi:hypothetical protein K9L97_01295 [Candidatus Woesearchaeota archaeon]|nr:hypothetical protein [Candidatus Woesearchaeota archaeon]